MRDVQKLPPQKVEDRARLKGDCRLEYPCACSSRASGEQVGGYPTHKVGEEARRCPDVVVKVSIIMIDTRLANTLALLTATWCLRRGANASLDNREGNHCSSVCVALGGELTLISFAILSVGLACARVRQKASVLARLGGTMFQYVKQLVIR